MCSEQHHSEQILCPHCDLLVELPALASNSRAVCPRCKTTLCKRIEFPHKLAMGYAFSALFMLLLANLFPFVNMEVAGVYSQITLTEIPDVMIAEGYSILSALFLVFVQIIPAFCMLAIPLLCLYRAMSFRLKVWLAKAVFIAKTWCMVEIFLAGVLVSFVKLMAYGDIGVGVSFFAYCIFCVLQVKALQCIDRRWLWQQIAPLPKLATPVEVGKPGLQQGVRSCPCCTAILPVDKLECPRCLTHGHARKHNSLQWTLALLITSVMLYIPANLLPIMVTEAFGSQISSTIMSGVILLWEDGSYPVALVIFIASILVPSLKILAISWLCWDTKWKKQRDREQMLRVYEIVEFVGRWSMIDVFVIAVLSALVRMGRLMSIYPDTGAVLFAMVVILTMFSAMAFDPRLSWDRVNKLDEKDSDDVR